MNRSEVYLAHHGIKGQKWGVRRYQNPDGTSTELGKRRDRKERKDNTKRATNSSEKTVAEKKKDPAIFTDLKTIAVAYAKPLKDIGVFSEDDFNKILNASAYDREALLQYENERHQRRVQEVDRWLEQSENTHEEQNRLFQEQVQQHIDTSMRMNDIAMGMHNTAMDMHNTAMDMHNIAMFM